MQTGHSAYSISGSHKKRLFDRIDRFCATHSCAKYTDTQNMLRKTCAGKGRIYRVSQKKWCHRLLTAILSNLNRFQFFFTGRFLGNYVVKWILKIPPHLAYVASLPCATLITAKQEINDNLQGSVATYLRCDGAVNSQM